MVSVLHLNETSMKVITLLDAGDITPQGDARDDGVVVVVNEAMVIALARYTTL